MFSKSAQLFGSALNVLPGGVNSPVRAYKSVDMTPPFITHAKGSKIYDEDGNSYIDYVCSWGPAILGHARPEIIKTIKEAVDKGTSYGAPTQAEVNLATLICNAVNSVEMVRMVSSGTEAVMSAIRVARGYTGRDNVLKFEGCYHGHSDGLLVKAGSGLMTLSEPDSAGVPCDYAKHTLTLPYNDVEALDAFFKVHGNTLAAAIVEPVAANMGVIIPKDTFLKKLRSLSTQYGVVLIFDEVITGFRLGYRGAQDYLGVEADLTTFGKIIGGGLPVGAYGGKRGIMQVVSPIGSVYQAGTLSGNPVAVAGGIKTLELLRDNPCIYTALEEKATILENCFLKASAEYNIPIKVNRVGSILSFFFNDGDVFDFNTASRSNQERFKLYFKYMLEHGIYIAPSPFEAIFVSDAHTEEDIARTCDVILSAFKALK